MIKRRIINIFILASIVILVLVLSRTGLVKRAIELLKNRLSSDGIVAEEQDDNPEYIYETFIDSEGNEVSVKMERKTGTIDGEEVVFYEDTMGSEVIHYRFYKGIIESIDNQNLILLVDTQCLNANLESSYHEYEDVDDYKKIFNIDSYNLLNNDELGYRDMVSVNTNEITSFSEISNFTNKYIRIQDVEFKDSLTQKTYKGLNIFTN